MAKKKKSQLKPVARGFATTSVPKKPTATEEELAPQFGDMSHKSTQGMNGDSSGKVDVIDFNTEVMSSAPFEGSECNVEKTEGQSLQNLVDKYQEKTEKDITRSIKVDSENHMILSLFDPRLIKAIEFDRRFSKTLPRLELDASYQERILQLVLEVQTEGQTGEYLIFYLYYGSDPTDCL